MAKTFNKSLRELFEQFSKLPSTKFKAGLAITALRESMNKAMAAQETYVIEVVGPYIFACGADIARGDATRILALDHTPYMVPLAKKYDFNLRDAALCVGFMKDAYANASGDARKPIVALSQQLLASYAQYKILLSEEKKS